MEVELNKRASERILHMILFELIANVLIAFVISRFLNESLARTTMLSLGSAVIAAAWNYLFNYLFDSFQRKYGFRRNTMARIIHACLFEIILIAVLTPVALLLLNISFYNAFVLEITLVFFFIPYTVLFNWVYDMSRWKIRKVFSTS